MVNPDNHTSNRVFDREAIFNKMAITLKESKFFNDMPELNVMCQEIDVNKKNHIILIEDRYKLESTVKKEEYEAILKKNAENRSNDFGQVGAGAGGDEKSEQNLAENSENGASSNRNKTGDGPNSAKNAVTRKFSNASTLSKTTFKSSTNSDSERKSSSDNNIVNLKQQIISEQKLGLNVAYLNSSLGTNEVAVVDYSEEIITNFDTDKEDDSDSSKQQCLGIGSKNKDPKDSIHLIKYRQLDENSSKSDKSFLRNSNHLKPNTQNTYSSNPNIKNGVCLKDIDIHMGNLELHRSNSTGNFDALSRKSNRTGRFSQE